MTLDHYGAYVAQFDVSWDEFTFDQNGKEVLTHKTWEGSGKDKTAHYSTVIPSSTKFKKYKNRSKRMYRSCMGMVENHY
ncbi:thiol-activated cytolysin C-terminal domain-containing protein [Bacillus paranthracis]